MSNTEKMINENLHSVKDGQGQAACSTLEIKDGTNKVKQSFIKNHKQLSEKNSNSEVKVPETNPKSGKIGNIFRLSKRKLSFPPPKCSDKDETKAESSANNSKMGIREEEKVHVALEDQVENTKSSLSVMEINQLITKKKLLEANENINKLEKELLSERKPAKDEELYQQYMVKVRDLNLLCDALAEQMMTIIANSLTISTGNSSYLCSAIKVIELEEATDKKWQEKTNHSDVESFRRSRKWQELWRETVIKSVRERIANVPLITKEQKGSWMAQHLSGLQQIIVEDLKIVKNFIQTCYPASYNIFNMYVKCYHQTVTSHLECIQQKQLESRDLYLLLNWIIHTYKSENVMSHPDLSPEVNVEELGPLLDQKIIMNVMDKYIETLKMIDEYTKESSKISEDLGEKVLCYCLEELTNFIHCYHQEVKKTQNSPNRLPILIVSINGYIGFGEFLETLKQDNTAKCVQKVEKELKNAGQELSKILSDGLLLQVSQYFKKLMTKQWLFRSEDFDQLISKAEKYCEKLKKMKRPNFQVLICDLHYRFVREYITQIMKRHVSYTSPSKRERAAKKIRDELKQINRIYEEFESEASWLFPVAQHLSDFIGTNENELESKLNALFEDYPDIGEEHISALLHFRGISKGRKSNLMKYFNNVEKKSEETRKITHPYLFAEIIIGPVTCLPSI
ncbi:exocyst complex component 3-like isoform X2 [Narcine bancroftii]|uniref:exocyst complex component 3-like isoform X2 n=1 Tax=Narcine bancroftii TaxID=1343680 RepID=UPI003831B552